MIIKFSSSVNTPPEYREKMIGLVCSGVLQLWDG